MIQANLLKQQKLLIQKIPDLKHFFVDIFIPQWNMKIPFLPIRCFRDFDLHTSFTEEKSDQFKIFLSSGSTGNNKSRHIFSADALKNYSKNTCQGFVQFLNRHNLCKDIPVISLIPPPKLWPTSSLAAMMNMFAQNKFNVVWCNIEEKKENLILSLEKLASGSSCIIFGTTFHHFLLTNEGDLNFRNLVQSHFKRLKISIIDTGGTKGRTRAFTLEQVIDTLKSFYTSPTFSFYSEYGMCELGSQAWSEKNIHDGSFICNKTLTPFSISIEKKLALPFEEKGFIGFIDQINQESWGAIITEDIGFTQGEKHFHLIGRGPDASIKGCSLNVRNHFSFDKISERSFLKKDFKLDLPIKISDISKILKEQKNWDKYSISDFQKISETIENEIPLDISYNFKNLLIISAANTPIAWLFPYLIACKNKASSITIKVPSLRLDDYYAENMAAKTRDLIQIISCYFPNTKTYIDSSKSIAHTFNDYNIVLTFGTNETLETISQQINHNNTKFIGKGDIKNSLLIDVKNNLVENIVDYCSLWNGRGCLTPVCLFCEGSVSDIKLWAKEFSIKLDKEFLERFENLKKNFVLEFAHSHNYSYVSGQIKQMGMDDSLVIYRGRLTCVVNLASCSEEDLINFDPDFSFGGCGFIYLLPSALKNKFPILKENPVLPDISLYY